MISASTGNAPASDVPAGEFTCPNSACPADRWLVARQPDVPDLWYIAETELASPWRVAAPAPFCPLCGTSLLRVSPTA